MKRMQDLLEAYKKKNLKIDNIFLGGGGNSGIECQDMACKWLRSEVMKYMGSMDNGVVVNNWEEITL